MNKRMVALLLAAAALVPGPVSAAVGGCPTGFHLHEVGGGDHEHEAHRHVGLSMGAVDRNGNGHICVKHVSLDGAIHVHIDDFAS